VADRSWLTRFGVLPFFAALFGASTFALAFPAAGQAQISPAGSPDPTPSVKNPGPSDRDLVVRALEYYRCGHCKEAGVIFEKILLQQPKDIAIRKLLANCYLQEKKVDAAKTQFQLVLKAAPRDAEAYQGLKASMREIQNQTLLRQRRALQSRAVTAEEYRAAHEMEDAENLIKARRFDDAERVLDDIVGRHPDSAPARQRLAEIYSTTKRFDKAAEMYLALTQFPKASPQLLLRVAQNMEWDKNYPKAAEYYRLYLQRNPRSSTALLAMARILMQDENYVEAPRYYRLYLQRNPQDTGARTILANMLMWSEHYSEAASEFERIKTAKPQDIRILHSLAQCYDQMEMKEKALDAYQEVLTLDAGNPAALKARSEYLRYFDELPRQQAYAALERNDLDASARYFIRYSEKHPENTEMLLQIARVYSWGRNYTEAEKYYRAYLKRAPSDAEIMRELARLEMGNQQYADARRYYEILTHGPLASHEDYEALLHTYTWSGDLTGAQPVAKKLSELETNNADALQALSDFAEQKRLAERTRAEELAAAHRYPEAIAAYRRYLADYGLHQQTELLIPRLYSWEKDFAQSTREYRAYLAKYPDDIQARLELANVENWSGHYSSAENNYRAVLLRNPHDVNALVGVAQVVDYQQRDPFEVRNDYLKVLKAAPRNSTAGKRLEEVHSQVAPTLTFSQYNFADSDNVFRSVNSVETTFPAPGRIKLTPFYAFGYFHQNVPDMRLTDYGNGAGGRIEVNRASGLSFLAELGGVYWSEHEKLGTYRSDTSRKSFYARADGSFPLGRNNTLGFNYVHKDAVYDLTTVKALAAGIMEDTLLVNYQRKISERVRFWTTGGMSHYTPGTLTSQFGNSQPRFSARLDFQARPWITLGYATRVTGFTSASPIYFSPTLYQTHGLSYTLRKTIARTLFVSVDGEFDYGRIGTHRMPVPIGPSATTTGASVNSFELAVAPRLKWRLRHGVTIQAGLRFSQGVGGSSLNAPGIVYRTGGGELSAVKVF
jgi:tetratricopeptide (TPR) repeat protein